MKHISTPERGQLARAAGVNDQYLYQCLTRRRDMDPKEAARVEAATGGQLRRWHLRRDWHLIWPELIGAEGAPPVPDEGVHRAAD